MKQCIISFLWGGITVAFWLLAWNDLGDKNLSLPNGFLAGAIINTVIVLTVLCTFTEDL